MRARGRSRIFAMLTIGLLIVMAGSLPFVTAQDSEQPTAFDMLAALNEWRLEEGLSPLRYNPTLEALAWLQAEYLLSLPNLPENIHDGILGEGPRERALWEPYNWPYYGIESRINLVEITVAQRTVAQGIDWWKHSDIHRQAATNPNNREVGVAALPYPYGTVFVAVLGGRPNVLPALIHPDGSTLYLTRETFWGAVGDEYMTSITGVRLLDSDRTPLTDWQRWRATLPMPEVSGDRLFVEYTDGDRTITTEVSLQDDVFPLPEYVDALVALTPTPEASTILTSEAAAQNVNAVDVRLTGSPDMLMLETDAPASLYLSDFRIFALLAEAPPSVTIFSEAFGGSRFAGPQSCYVFLAAGTAFELPDSCAGLVVLNEVPADAVFWYDSAQGVPSHLFVLSDRGRLLADCPADAGDCTFRVKAAPLGAGDGAAPITRELRLLYDSSSLAVLNNSGQHLNLFGLSMTDGTTTLDMTAWRTGASTASLGAFPTGGCLQVWEYGFPRQPKPPGCDVRHSWITVPPGDGFWVNTFEVYYKGQLLATCEADAGECVFELP